MHVWRIKWWHLFAHVQGHDENGSKRIFQRQKTVGHAKNLSFEKERESNAILNEPPEVIVIDGLTETAEPKGICFYNGWPSIIEVCV